VIIGKIAASHHWDLSEVAREFAEPLSPPADFPGWPIDALKLACILRCADACAIDERRAPTMAFIVENPRGVSRAHWNFQAYLKPAYLPAGQEAVVFQSTFPMKREHMDAWWLSYEAAIIADRELRGCNRLLNSEVGRGGRPRDVRLAARRVEGAGDADRLAQLVAAEGWRPIDTAVRISDPLALIERLGGKHLYGNDHTAPIRELVQNAADAVRALRRQNGYAPKVQDAGKIQVTIKKLGPDWVLSVADDGIGMPEEVLAGPFLDFGKSFWQSDRITSLYPGLASNREFRPTGQFGIGFYASFIIGRDVKVLTKPYNGGDDRRRVLHFLNGVRRRAELRAYDQVLDGAWPHGQNTIVEIRFTGDEWLSRFASLSFREVLDRPIISGEARYWDFFAKTLEQLVFCLDVTVNLTTEFFTEKIVNQIDIFETPRHVFAQQFNRVFATSLIDRIPDELIPLIETMNDGEKPRTRGTVTIGNFIKGIYHIGGLTVFSPQSGGPYGTRHVTGAHQAVPTTAARQSLERLASKDNFRRWAEVQLRKLDDVDLDDLQRGEALLSIHAITNDLAEKYFLFDLMGRILYFKQMEFSAGNKLFIICSRHPFANRVEISSYQGVLSLTSREHWTKSTEFNHIMQLYSGTHEKYGIVEFYDVDFTSDSSTAIGQLFAEIKQRGLKPSRSDLSKQAIGIYTGPDGGGNPDYFNNNIISEMPIEAFGFVITISEEEQTATLTNPSSARR
jgi:Histidine kinase-, DNA gyrase B-, and HSP90-like ATPase